MARESDSDVIAIQQLVATTYRTLVMAHDASGYANLYSDDVLWSPPNGPDQTSRQGIESGMQQMFDKFAFDVNLQAEEVEVHGESAYALGIVDGVLTPRNGEAPLRIRFRAFWLLRKEAGEWKIRRQIWNNKPIV